MVRTRSQLENLSKKELIEELISVEDISSKLSDVIIRFDDFLRRYEILSSELTVSKKYNRLLSERIVQLERNTVNNAQYHHRQSLEINPVPASIGDDVPESSVCKALSLTGYGVKPGDLQVCHHLKKKDTMLNLNTGSKNVAFLSTDRTSVINQMFSLNLIFLVGSSFRRAFERSQSTKIHDVIETKKLLGVDNLDEFINSTSF